MQSRLHQQQVAAISLSVNLGTCVLIVGLPLRWSIQWRKPETRSRACMVCEWRWVWRQLWQRTSSRPGQIHVSDTCHLLNLAIIF